ncbi:AmmeMemoRadiSam system protein B [Candidatus Bipolaricaulota bacterium]|nr:AmmeMemoRadiSam system protein B [Candidatus Bipolaricaulota bacterium]
MQNFLGPVVAGKFYPEKEDQLVDRIESCYTDRHGPGELPGSVGSGFSGPAGLVAPHAGYRYSGPVAAHAYHWIAQFGVPETVVLIGTNHSGFGPDASLLVEGGWSTPLGEVNVNEDLGKKVLESSDYLRNERSSFVREHSIEVQLPFLQHLWGNDFSILPVCLKRQDEEVAEDLANVMSQYLSKEILLVASTDFSHYEKQEIAEKKDKRAVQSIIDLDSEGFYKKVREHDISICGYGAIAVLLNIALNEALEPSELKYATSGEVAGYGEEVVGYSAIGFRK